MKNTANNSGWLNLEPKDKFFPVRHKTACKRFIGDLQIIGASIRGKKHAHFGEWRDDSFSITYLGPWAILTVADGAGSAPLSRVGANLAAKKIASLLKKQLIKFEINFTKDLEHDEMAESISSLFVNAFAKTIDSVQKESDKLGCPISHMATTLLSVLYIPIGGEDLFIWANVGDCVFAVFPTSVTCEVLCDEDHGTSGGETRFITSSGIKDSLKQRVHYKKFKNHVHSFALMTDGVSDDLYPLNDRLSGLLEGNVVGKGYMTDTKANTLKGINFYLKHSKNDSKVLCDWLKYNKTGSPYDDRTLIVALRNS